jgi:hypothetical protein
MKQDAFVLWSNHQSTAGIGEIVFTVVACLADRYNLRPTKTIRPGKINIIIDEFTNPYFLKQLVDIKKADPATKYVIVATEFITPVRIFGIEIARTFNFFWGAKDWLKLIHDRLFQGTSRLPSYMRQRYLGFMKALAVCDLLVFVHPSIGRELADVAQAYPNLASPPVIVYPELMPGLVTQDDRFEHLPIGFNLTGTLTRYRRKVMAKLAKQFRRTGWGQTIWRHVSFAESKAIDFAGSAFKFHYEVRSQKDFLFNINPPQQSGWPFSSPMRILRAALLGQIPVVTKKFQDHDIEDIALLWDGETDTTSRMLHLAMDRKRLVSDHMQSVRRYTAIAKDKNQAFLRALETLLTPQSCCSSQAAPPITLT